MWAACMRRTPPWRWKTPASSTPAAQITATAGDEKDAFFDPAEDKVYRHASFYKLPPEVDQM